MTHHQFVTSAAGFTNDREGEAPAEPPTFAAFGSAGASPSRETLDTAAKQMIATQKD